jgi:hypothetical protein
MDDYADHMMAYIIDYYTLGDYYTFDDLRFYAWDDDGDQYVDKYADDFNLDGVAD